MATVLLKLKKYPSCSLLLSRMSFYWIFYIMFLLTLTCRNHIRRTESMKEVVIQNLIAEKQVKIWDFLNQYIFFLLVSLPLMLAFCEKTGLESRGGSTRRQSTKNSTTCYCHSGGEEIKWVISICTWDFFNLEHVPAVCYLWNHYVFNKFPDFCHLWPSLNLYYPLNS